MNTPLHDTVHGLVSITRCAELLSSSGDPIDRSALSRYCDAHNLKRRTDGRQTLVDFESVRDHRAGSYTREVMSGRPLAPPPAPSNITPLDPVKRRAAAQATSQELDLAERLGELTAIAEVDAGAADAIAELRAAFAGILHDETEKLAAELGLAPERARILRAGLKRYGRVGQQRFAQKLAASLAAVNEPEDAAHTRLMHLTALAIRLRPRHGLSAQARA
jgi:hypothetical protein